MNTLQERIRGSLIGGAIGDALGYPIEFIYSFEEIQKRYGERGITRLDTKQHWLEDEEQAGGLGLNLTAANYVIHLDPWWNPAIEQQATDRAYRIGQHQNVTVYHLIAANTIEEKILRLHKTKCDLADALMQDQNTAHTLSLNDLKELVAIAKE